MEQSLRTVVLEFTDDEVEEGLAVLLERDSVEGTALTALDVGRGALDEVEDRTCLPVVCERLGIASAEPRKGVGRRCRRVVEGKYDGTGLSSTKLKVGRICDLGSLLFA